MLLAAAAFLVAVTGCAPTPSSNPDTSQSADAQSNAGQSADAERADAVAERARATYEEDLITTLGEMLVFQTVKQDGVANADNPEFQEMTVYLEKKAAELGLAFEDHGATVVISLGDAEKRLGLITHGDVQPADPTKWAADPFSLDLKSEPARLVGRGVEDDKGPIATALYAMKTIQDAGLPLSRKIELVVSYTEESDWQPFFEFLAKNPPADLNVALDAEYPVVTAEKGWCSVFLNLPADSTEPSGPWLASIQGGSFLSQIPEDARAVVSEANDEVEETLRAAANNIEGVTFNLNNSNGDLIVEASGVSSHSSKPWNGKNAITHLAQLLGAVEWPESQAARMVRLINDLVGTGDYAEKFGDVAYEHPFMGRLTLSLTTLGPNDDGALVAGINLRRPAGRTNEDVDSRIRNAVDAWKKATSINDLGIETSINDPYMVEGAEHVDVLLDVFRRHTGQENAEAISIGGGTHARVVPNGVNFGPSMPGEPYTGHSEHEYMSREQILLNLEMYTAMLVELATTPE